MFVSWKAKVGTVVAIVLGGGRAMRPIQLTIVCCLFASLGYAQKLDPLGSVDAKLMPVNAPSTDTTIRSFFMGGDRYDIPRNYLFSVEYLKSGSLGSISMRAVLPEVIGLTKKTIDCCKIKSACRDKIVVIGLMNDSTPVSGSQQLKNMGSLLKPGEKVGPCALTFYETRGVERQRFNYFVKKLNSDDDISVLRCPDERSDYAPFCVSQYNPIRHITFYYNFDRKFICDWEAIETKIRNRITAFER